MTAPQLLEVLRPAELVALVEALRQQGKAISAKERFPDHHIVPSERDVEVLRLRIVDGATHEATARAVGLSKLYRTHPRKCSALPLAICTEHFGS